MKKTPLNKQSPKQKDELAKRRLLKWQLYNEQQGLCAKCGRFLWWDDNHREAANYPHLSHKERLSKGKKTGVTTRKNCEVLCAECHSNKEHGLRNFYGEQPDWSKNT